MTTNVQISIFLYYRYELLHFSLASTCKQIVISQALYPRLLLFSKEYRSTSSPTTLRLGGNHSWQYFILFLKQFQLLLSTVIRNLQFPNLPRNWHIINLIKFSIFISYCKFFKLLFGIVSSTINIMKQFVNFFCKDYNIIKIQSMFFVPMVSIQVMNI